MRAPLQKFIKLRKIHLIMRETVNVAIIRNAKILLVRKGQSWLLPGGKPNPGESDIGCLCREVDEELSGTRLENIKYYNEFVGDTHIQERFRTKVYLADIGGELREPSAEIKEYGWVDNTSKYNLSDMNLKVMDSLIRDGYLRRPSD